MDELDYRILQALQNDFPLSPRPYEIIARKLQISCEQLWNKLQKLMADGVIRRIGASLDSHKLGYCSTLAAISVEDSVVEQAALLIPRLVPSPCVSMTGLRHSCRRLSTGVCRAIVSHFARWAWRSSRRRPQ